MVIMDVGAGNCTIKFNRNEHVFSDVEHESDEPVLESLIIRGNNYEERSFNFVERRSASFQFF